DRQRQRAHGKNSSRRPAWPGRVPQAEAALGLAFLHSFPKSLAKQKSEILKTVAPRHEFSLAYSLGVADKDFTKPDVLILYGFNFNLFTERHAVAYQFHLVQGIPAEDPHSGLRVM